MSIVRVGNQRMIQVESGYADYLVICRLETVLLAFIPDNIQHLSDIGN